MKKLEQARFIIGLLVSVFLLAGCLTSASKLKDLRLGMTKDEVKKVMGGEPEAVKGTVKNQFGQIIEVWMYWCDQGDAPDAAFWVYFCDDRLAEWGPAPSDWTKERERLGTTKYEMPTR